MGRESNEQKENNTDKTWRILLIFTFFIAMSLITAGIGYNVAMIEAEAQMMESIDTSVILECPFCGGEAKDHTSDTLGYTAWVECEECHISTDHYNCTSFKDAKEQAIKAWNRRKGE